jgi:hypothetical protein
VNHDLEKGKTYLHAEALLEGSIIALKENKKNQNSNFNKEKTTVPKIRMDGLTLPCQNPHSHETWLP